MHKNISGWQQLTRPIWFSASLPLGLRLTILAGVLLSTFTSIILWNWQMEYSRLEQEKQAEALAYQIKQSIDDDLQILWSMGNFYPLADNLNQQTFRQLATYTLGRYSSLHTLAWVPRILERDRLSYTSGASVAPLEIWEQNSAGDWIVAPQSSEYFPVTYLQSNHEKTLPIGWNIASDPIAKEAIETARNSTQLVVSQSLNIPGNQQGIFILVPVYAPGSFDTPSRKISDLNFKNNSDFQGFLLGVLRLQDVILQATQTINLTHLNLCIYAENDSNQLKPIAFYHSQNQRVQSDNLDNCREKNQQINQKITIRDRRWWIFLQPTSEYQYIHSPWLIWSVLLTGLLWTSIPGTALLMSVHRSHQREQLVQELAIANFELSETNLEIARLNRISDLLQACLTVQEAYTVLPPLVQPLLPDLSGGIFVIDESKNLVELVTYWGEPLTSNRTFFPDQCIALRRGQIYCVHETNSGLLCQHLDSHHIPTEYICLPMVAHGEILGMFYVGSLKGNRLTERKQQLAEMLARQIAMAFANLKMRESLKHQSICDPLTGLFNRRYMEEALNREIRRAEQNSYSVGMIMLDVDYFKRVNDTFGHEAGDLLLKDLGKFLQKSIRTSDIACRYGGEEFTLILPETSFDVLKHRAENLCQQVKSLEVEYQGQQITPITVSLGVALFPDNGFTSLAILRAADAALYQAKHEGRDRVVMA